MKKPLYVEVEAFHEIRVFEGLLRSRASVDASPPGMVYGPRILADWVVGWLDERVNNSDQETDAGGGW